MSEQTTKQVAAALRQFAHIMVEIKEELAQRRVGERAAEHQPEPAHKKAGHAGSVMESADEGDSNAHEYTRILSGDKTKISRRSLPAMPRRPGKRERGQVLDLESLQETMAGYRAKPIAEHEVNLREIVGQTRSPAKAPVKSLSKAVSALPKALKSGNIGEMFSVGKEVFGAARGGVGAIGGMAGGAVGAGGNIAAIIVGFAKATEAVQAFGKSIWKSNEAIAAFSPQIAALTAEMHAQDIQLAVKQGQDTGRSAAILAEQLKGLNNETADWQNSLKRMENLLGAAVVHLGRYLNIPAALTNTGLHVGQILDVLEEMAGGEKPGGLFVTKQDFTPNVGNVHSGGNVHGTGNNMRGPWQREQHGANQPGMATVPGFHQAAPQQHVGPQGHETVRQQQQVGQQMAAPPSNKNLADFAQRNRNGTRGQPQAAPEGNEAENLFHPQTLGPE